MTVVQINKPKWDAWKMLPEAVRSGEVPFALAHGGLDMHQVCPVGSCAACMAPAATALTPTPSDMRSTMRRRATRPLQTTSSRP